MSTIARIYPDHVYLYSVDNSTPSVEHTITSTYGTPEVEMGDEGGKWLVVVYHKEHRSTFIFADYIEKGG